MKNFKGFCRRVLFPLLLAVLVLSAWYFTRVLPVRGGAAASSVQRTSPDSAAASSVQRTSPDSANSAAIDESESYTARDDVALYLATYGHLPDNFITKREAEALGWDSRAGNLDEVAPGKSIGGDRYGNYEGGLPDKEGRKWRECDIGYDGGYRSAQRILFSSDGLVYYTEDHYKTFTRLC